MELIFVGIFLLLDALFNGLETGLISINRIWLHSRLEEGDKRAHVLAWLVKNSENVIGALLAGINICDVAVVINFTGFMLKNTQFGELTPLLVTLILTPVVLIFASLFPKIIFREFSDTMMITFAYPLRFIYWVLYPVQFIFLKTIKGILSLLGFRKKNTMFSKDEFNLLLDITADKGLLKESEKDFIESIMNFKNIKAREVMVPLIRMTCVEENDPVEIASALMLTTGHSRLPVFRMRVDNMIGYIENKDLLTANKHDKVGSYVKETLFVPDISPINHVLVNLQKKMAQMAFVVDEYGGVAGVITNQDIITEIIGEFVEIKEEWIQKENDAYIVNGMVNIDEINEELNLNIQKHDFETVAGYVLERFERIPAAGESFDIGRYTFEVASASTTRVKKVKIYHRKKKEKKRGIK